MKHRALSAIAALAVSLILLASSLTLALSAAKGTAAVFSESRVRELVVTDSSGRPLPGVFVHMHGKAYVTDAGGAVYIPIPFASEPSYALDGAQPPKNSLMRSAECFSSP